MSVIDLWKKTWAYLKRDSWDSWLVSLALTFVFIKFVFFPVPGFTMRTSLPLVVVESCSMYHSTDFDDWWERNSVWYENKDITIIYFDAHPDFVCSSISFSDKEKIFIQIT